MKPLAVYYSLTGKPVLVAQVIANTECNDSPFAKVAIMTPLAMLSVAVGFVGDDTTPQRFRLYPSMKLHVGPYCYLTYIALTYVMLQQYAKIMQ